MRKIIVAIAAASLLAIFSMAHAEPIQDTVRYWSGVNPDGSTWSFGTNATTTFKDKTMDNSDAWGTPNITGGNFSFTGTALNAITLNFSTDKAEASIWNTVFPGDFFMDLNSDGRWDLVLDNQTLNNPNKEWNAYKVDLKITENTNYEYSRLSSTSTGAAISSAFNAAYLPVTSTYTYSGGIPRYDHPVAIRDALLTEQLGKVNMSGWISSISSSPSFSISWDLAGLSLDFQELDRLGYGFGTSRTLTYGFAVSCANDVIFGQAPIPNPEPGTMLLMGAGVLGAAFLRKRSKKAL